ncbi:hypothetical protein SAMN05421630_11363 [Prauserella marina]|uniref:Uncharacterized protein n=1 Tax=Prauserella marina TaxID=530584 RepID=A0A1G6Y0S2_9PSEU|nr:hypothetical protein DES30_103154 [Prauserella marina]SDD83910.1 hypothetical protein SAMN05421630_11363 [Prauserella marina]
MPWCLHDITCRYGRCNSTYSGAGALVQDMVGRLSTGGGRLVILKMNLVSLGFEVPAHVLA